MAVAGLAFSLSLTTCGLRPGVVVGATRRLGEPLTIVRDDARFGWTSAAASNACSRVNAFASSSLCFALSFSNSTWAAATAFSFSPESHCSSERMRPIIVCVLRTTSVRYTRRASRSLTLRSSSAFFSRSACHTDTTCTMVS